MHDIIHLVLGGLYNFRVAVSRAVDCDAAIKIQIRHSLFVIQIHSLGTLCNKIIAFIGFHHILIYHFL